MNNSVELYNNNFNLYSLFNFNILNIIIIIFIFILYNNLIRINKEQNNIISFLKI
jgi:hypothetical protein